MFTNIEHIGIAVRDLTTSNELFSLLLNSQPYKAEEVASEGVMTSFFRVAATKIELLSATRPDSPVAVHLAKRGEGIHHLAFEVDDIQAEMERLRAAGFHLLNEKPKLGADNKLVCFVHPKTANGVLIELCQEIKKQEPLDN